MLAPGVGTVEVGGAFLVLGGLKLETAGLDETVDWLFEESVVIPLDLSGGKVLAFDTDVPAGTYKELEISIDKLEVGKQSEQALIDEFPSLADASVLVMGTVTRDGSTSPFTFTAALDIDMELFFPSALTVTDQDVTATLISLTLDTDTWFRGAGGELFDPSNEGDRSAIEATITASIKVAMES